MSVAPQTSSPLPLDCPSGEDWVTLDEAARRSGLSAGHIKRLCGSAKWAGKGGTYADRGLARLVPSKSGGMPTWEVHVTADPRFARVKFPEQMGNGLADIPTGRGRETAQLRRRVLAAWEAHCKAASGFGRKRATEHFAQRIVIDSKLRDELKLPRGFRVCPATLYNWERSWRSGGTAALADGRSAADAPAPPAEDPFLAEVQRLYLSTHRPRLTDCHSHARIDALKNGWTIRSYKACQRHIDKLPKSVVLLYRQGEEAYVNQAEPYAEQDYTTLESNEKWCSDHHQFDVLVKVGGQLDAATGEVVTTHKRPWITPFMDLRSRRIVAWKVYAHDPNSDAIFEVFRMAVMNAGVPRGLLIDNGKDFDCYDLNGRTKKDRWKKRRLKVELDPIVAAGLFAELHINVQHARPFHGQSKGALERWFGTLEQKSRACAWPTYCGNSPGDRPRSRVGKDDVQIAIERGQAPTFEEFAAWVDEWVAAYNAGHEHSGQGMDGKTPDAVFSENLVSKRTAPQELLDLLCLRRIDRTPNGDPLCMRQNGIQYKGLKYGQYHPALNRLIDRPVVIRVDPRDVSVVRVFTPDDTFICIARANAKIPGNAGAELLREASASKASDRRFVKQFHQRRMRLADDLPDRVIRVARAKAAAAKPAEAGPPPSIAPVRHPLEDQLPALQRALEAGSNKIAVGAESMSMADLGAQLRDGPDLNEDIPDDSFARLRDALRSDQGSGDHD